MIEENSSQDSKQGSQQSSGADRKQPPETSVNKIGGKPSGIPPKGEPKQPRKLLVEILKDDELRPFEKETLGVAKQTFRLTLWAVIIAAIGAAFVLGQLQQMTWNNQILASQSESAVTGAIESERITREQLKIARDQATAAKNSVEAIQNQMRLDQRAWVTVDVGEKAGNFSVNMHNTGRTPALNVTYTVGFTPGKLGVIPDVEGDLKKSNSSTPMPLPKNLPPDMLDRLKKEGVIRERPPTGFVIAPDKSEIASYYGTKFSQVIGSDAQRIYIQGRITYDDVFGHKHETFFCYWYAAPNAYPMCRDHNKMD